MKLKTIISAAAAVALASTLAGCGGGSAPSKDAGDAKTTSGQNVRVWFMEGSISDEAQKYLQDEFAKENPGNTLKVEVQQWDGIVSKLQTSLASKNESPDLVEIGNTQTTTFAEVGAFADSTDLKGELGGDKLIPSFVEASTIDSKIYAYPLYAGARAVFYRKDLLEKAGLPVPSTIDELRDTVIKLQAANPEGKDGFAGMYLAAVDPHGVESYLFASGFDYAKLEGKKWVGKANTPESLGALKSLQDIFKNGTTFGLDTKASQKSFERYFNDGTVGVMIATGNIGNKIDQSLWDAGKVGVMPLPSKTAGKVGATFAGGSNIAIAQNSANPELAKAAMKVIFSEGFQRLIAKDGWVPGNTTYGDDVTGPFSEIASDVVQNSKLTPNNAQWGVEFGDKRVNDFFTRLAKGEDVEKTAQQFNDDLDSILNK